MYRFVLLCYMDKLDDDTGLRELITLTPVHQLTTNSILGVVHLGSPWTGAQCVQPSYTGSLTIVL